jgi:hypothetical protein
MIRELTEDRKPPVDERMTSEVLRSTTVPSAPALQTALQTASHMQPAQISGASGAPVAPAGASHVWSRPSDGMRAVGTGSPSPAVTPPPVMQRQGPAEDREMVARSGGSRPSLLRGAVGDGENEEARLRDAAEVCPSHSAVLTCRPCQQIDDTCVLHH